MPQTKKTARKRMVDSETMRKGISDGKRISYSTSTSKR